MHSHNRIEESARAVAACASPVTIVTSNGPAGRVGQTVSAFTAVSADPAIILVCIHGRSPLNEIIAPNGGFRVNVLGTAHDHVADTFAGRPWDGKGRYDFTCGDWDVEAENGPRLLDATASFTCDVHQELAVGTHRVWFGGVRDADIDPEMAPLVYLKRIYRQLADLPLSTFPDFPNAKPPYERTR